MYRLSVWVTWPERSKGLKDKVKRPPARSQSPKGPWTSGVTNSIVKNRIEAALLERGQSWQRLVATVSPTLTVSKGCATHHHHDDDDDGDGDEDDGGEGNNNNDGESHV